MSAEPVTRRRRMPRRPNPVVPDFPPLSVPGPAWVLRGSQLTIRLLLLAASVAWVSPAASQDAPTHREPVQNRDTSAEAPEDSAAGDGQPVESKEERRKRQTREALERLNDFRALRKRFIIDTDTGEVRGYLWGNAEGFYESRGETWRVFADAILVEGLFEEVTETEETDQGSKEKKKTRGKPRSFYAEGNVRLHGREVTLGMDAFYYDHVQQRGIALRTSGRGRLPSADRLSEIFSRENLASERRRGFVGGTTMGANFPSLEEDRQRRQEATDSSGVTRALPLGDGVRRAALQMAFRAEVLRVVDVDSYEGEGIVLSSCEFGVPHFGLHSGLMSIEPVPEHDDGHDDDHDEAEDMEEESDEGAGTENTEDAEAEESEREISKHRAIDPEDTWLQFNGLSLVPFPVGYWNTEWIEYNPIRSFGFTTSSKYGNRVDVEWNLNWILKQFPGTDSGYLGEFLDDSELGVITDYMSKRGFGHGVVGEYGTRPLRWNAADIDVNSWNHWDYYGRSLYYGLDDHGRDRTAPIGAPDPGNDRDWATVLHRQRLPWIGTLDVEYSEQSDVNFLREFFPNTQTEKEQESLFYLRRTVTDNVAVSALHKYRSNDYETTRERVPEGKLFIMEQPVFNSGLYTDLNIQAANLRLRPGDGDPQPGRRYGRYDMVNEWAYPFGFGDYLRLRPFFAFRYSAYEEGLDPSDHSLERESFRGGVAATQEWSRVFNTDRGGFMRRWFGIHALKHAMVPQVAYSNLWDNDIDPEVLFPFDDVDLIDNQESLSFSIRNILWARGPRVVEPADVWSPGGDTPALRSITRPTRAILDADLRLTWFPQPERDNSGDRVSLFDVDISIAPTNYLIFRSRDFFDPNDDMDIALTDNSVTFIPVQDKLSLTVGERFREGLSEFIYGRVGVQMTPKYYVEFYGGMDLEVEERTDIEVRLIRFMHRFALELSYSWDRGENDNHTFGVNFYPVEFFEDFWTRSSYDGGGSRYDYESVR